MTGLRIITSVAIVGAGLFYSGHKDLPCHAYYRNDLVVTANRSQIVAEAARTPGAQSVGLGGRSCIGRDEGMLFIFQKPATYSFWMKDMRFPIDIVWIAANHHVVKIQRSVSPNSYPKSFKNDRPAKYVLEIGAGRASELGIRNGSTLQFPNP